ncbi:GNAT family N-acetyltransferase [Rhodococcus coprophilus]|uniref:Acetyltransferase n=1 Tax=Rhodococcus coprophilus TaxID=38310 RepID=A0A2X4WQT1_9NOCA|nr:GNAT family N-acetyltransferase [Rhodococcus coprophilus]MBM7461357.1 putative GNAT family acetyltransferase [Rhodococcus coprophilus]SQI29295.1 acetyltransferase [Rhodococcus coprophilus]
MLKLLGVRSLGGRDTASVLRVLARDPVASCMVAGRIEQYGLDGRAVGGDMWSRGGPESSLCFAGANLIPLLGNPDDIQAFAERAVRGPRLCSSIVGRAEYALPMWDALAPSWGPPREIRAEQPLLVLDREPRVAPDPQVRRVRPEELDAYLPAAISMFIEEVGVDPRLGDGGAGYRRRVASLIATGRAWARFEEGRVVFKAEVGSQSSTVGQIQGVWVDPEKRGLGLGSAGTAAVGAAVTSSGRLPSLYVNSFNTRARAAYERVGFRQVATFTTVLLD